MTVTVLLAVHNGGEYLRDAVTSVLAQTHQDLELLVVDDGSTDGSAALVESFADPRIRLLRNDQNLGQVPSLNRGLAEARGEIVARLDADDTMLPTCVERQVAVLAGNAAVGLVGTWLELRDEHDRRIGALRGTIDTRVDFVAGALTQYLPIPHPGSAYWRALALELGGYDASLAPSEDKDLWRRMLLAGAEARIVREPLVRYRVHPGQLSQTDVTRQRQHDDRGLEAFLDALWPGCAAGPLRLLLSGDRGAWQLLAAGAIDAESVAELLRRTSARLALDTAESAELERRIALRLGTIALAGWRAPGRDWSRSSGAVVRWAGARSGRRWLPAAHAAVRATAPLLRGTDAAAGTALGLVVELGVLRGLRAAARRSQRLRQIYAAVLRKT